MSEIINEKELGKVSGGWQYANGSYVDYGNCPACGGALLVFCRIGQQLTIYTSVKR